MIKKEYFSNKNNLQHNGRVAVGFSRDTWIGACVSPYMKDFKNQVDLGIWPLVNILFKKGYLTCSSCEGHEWMESSFVVVCFGSEESRDKFVKQVLKAKIPQYKIFYHNSQNNINLYKISTDYKKYQNKNKIYVVNTQEKISEELIKEEIKTWNHCFGRKYKKWYYCRILIGGAALNGKTLTTLFTYWTRYFWIKRLTNFIEKKVSIGYD